jgi:hypothetical protein
MFFEFIFIFIFFLFFHFLVFIITLFYLFFLNLLYFFMIVFDLIIIYLSCYKLFLSFDKINLLLFRVVLFSILGAYFFKHIRWQILKNFMRLKYWLNVIWRLSSNHHFDRLKISIFELNSKLNIRIYNRIIENSYWILINIMFLHAYIHLLLLLLQITLLNN